MNAEISFNGKNDADEMVEIIKLMKNGDIYIKGKLVTNDLEVVEGMRAFLKESGYIR